MDIVVSSVRAYISALNKLLGYKNKPNQKVSPEYSHVSATSASVAAASS